MNGAPACADVLVVGAGPTGLALASTLAAYGLAVRVVDATAGPVPESRALAVQPRTLEVLPAPVTGRLLERGNRGVRLVWHGGGRTAELPLFDLGLEDTAFPFLLFVSQAETETALVEHLAGLGTAVEWSTRLEALSTGDGEEAPLRCTLTGADGRLSTVSARYVVGCDGAHSTVREAAAIGFTGGRYPQTFLLADTDADGVQPGAAHVWLGESGPLFFFPLVRPAAWRVLTPRPSGSEDDDPERLRSELQSVVDAITDGTVRLGAPVWSTAFRIHHRHAESYRRGRVFLAGDAAHIHSPAGAQGMNTGIQDAVNLGWKLGLVCEGRARPELLDTYDSERRPVGALVLRFTDRAFTVATSTSPVVRLARTRLAPRALAVAARAPRLRAAAFRTVSQLSVRYPPMAAAPTTGPLPTRSLWVPFGRQPHPRPGERLPDAPVESDGHRRRLQEVVSGPAFHLLLCGPVSAAEQARADELSRRYPGLLRVVRLTRDSPHGAPVGLTDAGGTALRRLGVRGSAYLLVRPDGHVASRGGPADLDDLAAVLRGWLIW